MNCTMCGKTALYKVGTYYYCKVHRLNAVTHRKSVSRDVFERELAIAWLESYAREHFGG